MVQQLTPYPVLVRHLQNHADPLVQEAGALLAALAQTGLPVFVTLNGQTRQVAGPPTTAQDGAPGSIWL